MVTVVLQGSGNVLPLFQEKSQQHREGRQTKQQSVVSGLTYFRIRYSTLKKSFAQVPLRPCFLQGRENVLSNQLFSVEQFQCLMEYEEAGVHNTAPPQAADISSLTVPYTPTAFQQL